MRLETHQVRSFKLSNDPRFTEKLEDIVGLYMAPPEHALVLCCDEKSQVHIPAQDEHSFWFNVNTDSG